jgi:ERCC4-type nuclease
MILCSPTEPKSIRKELKARISSKPEELGVDFMWVNHGRRFGIQRKRYPEDLEASLNDGRLAKELGQMADIDQAFLVLEGFGQWTTDGEPMGNYHSLNKSGMFGLLTSVSLSYNVPTYRVKDQAEFCEIVLALYDWTSDEKHLDGVSSLARRPSAERSKWGTRTSEAWSLWLLQSFNGIGPVQAKAILKHFGGIPMRWDVDSPKEFEEIDGIGPKRAQTLWDALA